MLNGGGNELSYGGGFHSWPAAANSTAYGSPYYALCTHVEIPSNLSSQFSVPDYFTGGPADINTDNNIYKVISDNAPTVTLSANPIAQGQTLTITGHNWIPVYPDQPNTVVGVGLFQFPLPNQRIDYALTTPTVDASGSFAVSFPITSAYPPGRYNAGVGSVTVHLFSSELGGGVPFQVVAGQSVGSGGEPTATPTPSHTATPTPSHTATPTPSHTATPGPGTATVTGQPTATPGTLPVSSTTTATGGGGGVLWLIGALEAVLVLGTEAARTFFATRAQSRRDYPYG